ncbi:MAG TPA: DnaJ domain-containing protein [Thermoanaerobaculia bacterium]|nr:DnaJ domain-containing protein [Thermoanaerobaculia bacterium]
MSDPASAGQPPKAGACASAAMALADWLGKGRSGVVEVRAPGGTCRLHLDGAALRLAPDDPLANAGAEACFERLLEILASATADSLQLMPDTGVPSAGSSLPAVRLLMEAAVRGRDRAQLWTLLGGRKAALCMAGGTALASQALADLEPRLQALLARFVKPRPVLELIDDDEAGFAALRDVARLRVVGLLAPAEGDVESSMAALTGRSRELFLRRIASELERRPLELRPPEHRSQVVDMLRRVGAWSYYELLRVGRHDDENAIHRAYVEVARLVHPSHAEALGLEGKAAALDLLFEAATEAYLVLSHLDRRRAYDRDLGPERGAPASEERRREKASVARDMYARARRMALAQEFQPVIELMQQAVQLDPQAEYYKLLGDVQRRNPQWKAGAVASYRDALRCRPDDPDLRLAFAQVLEELGDRKQAGVQYRAALELRPGDEKLRRALDRFENPKSPKSLGGRAGGSDGGMFSTFRNLFRRGRSTGDVASKTDGDDTLE